MKHDFNKTTKLTSTRSGGTISYIDIHKGAPPYIGDQAYIDQSALGKGMGNITATKRN